MIDSKPMGYYVGENNTPRPSFVPQTPTTLYPSEKKITMFSLLKLLATNERAREIYLKNCELLSQGKLPPCIRIIKEGEGKILKKRKRSSPPPPTKKIKLVDLAEEETSALTLKKRTK